MDGTVLSVQTTPFFSWRWRVLLPLFTVMLVAAMVGIYLLAGVPEAGVSTGARSFALEARVQLVRLLFASMAGAIIIVVFLAVNWLLSRVNAITRVVEALAAGQGHTRTGMKPTDEIGRLGAALDYYADRVQERHDALRASLRRQRRETEHLTAVLEALPDGIVVQDLDGRVMMMNDKARALLGSQKAFHTSDLNTLTATVTDILGPALAPGLYALGDPKCVECDGRMLSAQAAAVMSLANQRVGTVLVLRDITEDIRRERARDALIDKLTAEVQSPISELGRLAANERRPLAAFAREITRHAVALQKLLVEMRELTADIDTRALSQGQHPLPLENFAWAVANEWRKVAQAANITINVRIAHRGMYVLGDERRLRWAVGNIVDNAIKYSPPGGSITIEVSGEKGGNAFMRVIDTGVGIAPDELPHVFTRFFRGNPVTEGGRAIHAPGTGQGLTIARQIIEAHGGRVYIKSQQFEGTTVFIILPLTAPVSMEVPRLFNEATIRETEKLTSGREASPTRNAN
ncbi:MAG: ATP-binding protein [Chloroflexota bacterium]